MTGPALLNETHHGMAFLAAVIEVSGIGDSRRLHAAESLDSDR